MSADRIKTLEDIEALASEANESGETTRMRVLCFPKLLAIAQSQREDICRIQITRLRRMAKHSREIVGNWPRILASFKDRFPPDQNSWRARWIRRHAALQNACRAKIARLRGEA